MGFHPQFLVHKVVPRPELDRVQGVQGLKQLHPLPSTMGSGVLPNISSA